MYFGGYTVFLVHIIMFLLRSMACFVNNGQITSKSVLLAKARDYHSSTHSFGTDSKLFKEERLGFCPRDLLYPLKRWFDIDSYHP